MIRKSRALMTWPVSHVLMTPTATSLVVKADAAKDVGGTVVVQRLTKDNF